MIDIIISSFDTRSELISGGELKTVMSIVEFPSVEDKFFGKKVGVAQL